MSGRDDQFCRPAAEGAGGRRSDGCRLWRRLSAQCSRLGHTLAKFGVRKGERHACGAQAVRLAVCGRPSESKRFLRGTVCRFRCFPCVGLSMQPSSRLLACMEIADRVHIGFAGNDYRRNPTACGLAAHCRHKAWTWRGHMSPHAAKSVKSGVWATDRKGELV